MLKRFQLLGRFRCIAHGPILRSLSSLSMAVLGSFVIGSAQKPAKEWNLQTFENASRFRASLWNLWIERRFGPFVHDRIAGLRVHHYKYVDIFLTGSLASGLAHPLSDVDIAVVHSQPARIKKLLTDKANIRKSEDGHHKLNIDSHEFTILDWNLVTSYSLCDGIKLQAPDGQKIDITFRTPEQQVQIAKQDTERWNSLNLGDKDIRLKYIRERLRIASLEKCL